MRRYQEEDVVFISPEDYQGKIIKVLPNAYMVKWYHPSESKCQIGIFRESRLWHVPLDRFASNFDV